MVGARNGSLRPIVKATMIKVDLGKLGLSKRSRKDDAPDAADALGEARLDELPYGVIVVDPAGTVLAFNRAESAATGISRAQVLGRNFFRDVAPCTSVRAFAGRFEAFVADARREIEPFEFVFPFASGAQRVSILFTRGSTSSEHISIIVTRAQARP